MSRPALSVAVAMGATALATAAQASSYVFSTINPPGTPARDVAQAYSVNDNGLVAVVTAQPGVDFDYTDFAGVYDGVRHTFAAIPAAPGAEPLSTQLVGINTHGLIVGFYHPPGGYWQGFALSGGVFSPLNAFGGFYNTPEGLNDKGAVVGAYGGLDSTLGYVYSGGVFTSINAAPNGPYSTGAVGINDSGAIVGDWGLSATADYPNSFLLVGGVFSPIAMPGYGRTNVAAINDPGVIVGGVTNDNFATGSAFILDHGVYTLLNYPGAVDTYAFGINDKGWIAGRYTDANGRVNAFLAIPVPEPGAWALMLAGFGLAGVALRRRARGGRVSAL